jgi:microcystin-dependent protein
VTLSTANLPAHSHTLPAGGNTANTGAGVSYTNLQPSLALNFQIALQGIFPLQSGGLVVDTAPLIATIRMTAGNQTSPGYSSAQGQLMAIGPNQTLFELLGTTFGGDGRTSFSLPNLSGRAVLGAGAAPGLTPHDLGESAGVESVSLSTSQLPPHVHTLPGGGTTGIEGAGQSQTNMQPTLALHYIIATEGPYPSQNTGGAADEAPFLGQIDLFAGNFAPSGWAFTDGQMLPITLNSALFSLLGTTFGGDGVSMFALPDLRDRVAVGAGSGVGLSPWDTGQQTGTESLVLLTDQMPAHDHAFTPVPEPASVYVLAAASTLFLLGCRRHRAVQSNDA